MKPKSEEKKEGTQAPSRAALRAAAEAVTEEEIAELRATVSAREAQLRAALVDAQIDALAERYAVGGDVLKALYRDRFEVIEHEGTLRAVARDATGEILTSRDPLLYGEPAPVSEVIERAIDARADSATFRRKPETSTAFAAPTAPPKSEADRQREALQQRMEHLKTRHGLHDDAEYVRVERQLEELRIRDLEKRQAAQQRKYTGEDLHRLRRQLRETTDPLVTCQLESAIYDAECDLGMKTRQVAP